MSDETTRPERHSIRLPEYEYSQPGMYYVTICVRHKKPFFGRVIEDKVRLSRAGEIADSVWKSLPGRFPCVSLDEYILMPDHIHGIIVIGEGSQTTEKPPWLGRIVGQFKGASSYLLHRNGLPRFQWHHNYYEHIIRPEEDLERVRRYIIENPICYWIKLQERRSALQTLGLPMPGDGPIS